MLDNRFSNHYKVKSGMHDVSRNRLSRKICTIQRSFDKPTEGLVKKDRRGFISFAI